MRPTQLSFIGRPPGLFLRSTNAEVGDYKDKSGFIDAYAGPGLWLEMGRVRMPTRNGSEYLAEGYRLGEHLRDDVKRGQFGNTLSVFYYKREPSMSDEKKNVTIPRGVDHQ